VAQGYSGKEFLEFSSAESTTDSARLPLMRPGFDSGLVPYVGLVCCWLSQYKEDFSPPGRSGFPLYTKTNQLTQRMTGRVQSFASRSFLSFHFHSLGALLRVNTVLPILPPFLGIPTFLSIKLQSLHHSIKLQLTKHVLEERFFFHTEEGLYTRNVCVNRQFRHFLIIIPLNISLIFYYQVSRIPDDFFSPFMS